MNSAKATVDKLGFRDEVTLNDMCPQTCCDHFTASIIMTVEETGTTIGLYEKFKSKITEGGYCLRANTDTVSINMAFEEQNPRLVALCLSLPK